MWYRKSDQLDENGQPVIDMGNTIYLRKSDSIPEDLVLNDDNYRDHDGKYDGWHYSKEEFTEELLIEFLNNKEGLWNRIKNWFS